jgi:hypothetical protein
MFNGLEVEVLDGKPEVILQRRFFESGIIHPEIRILDG